MSASELEPSFQFRRSLRKFTVLILLAFAAAILSQALLKTARLEEKVAEGLSSLEKDFLISTDGVAFHFRNGWWPVLGVRLARLELTPKRCPDRHLVLHDLLVPFRPLSTVTGGAPVSVVEIGLLEATWANCHPGDTPHRDKRNGESQPSQVSVAQDSLSRQLQEIQTALDHIASQAQQQVQRQIRGLRVRKGLVRVKSGAHQVRAEFELSLKVREQISMAAELKTLRRDEKELPGEGTKFEGDLEDLGLGLKLRVPVREGQVLAQVSLPTSISQELPTVSVQVKRVPLSFVSQFFLSETPLSYLWWDCHLKLSGAWEKLADQKIMAESCLMNGPYGQVHLSNLDLNLRKLQGFDVKIDQLDLDQVVKNKRAAYFSGILSRYGILKLEGRYKGGEIDVAGALVDTEVLFSQQNRRDLQKIKKASFRVKGSKFQWQALVDEVDLHEGLWRGQLRAQKGRASDEIQVQLEVEEARLHPNIYKLVLNSEPTVISLFGEGTWLNGRLQNWSVLMGAPEVQAADYLLKQLKVKGGQERGQSAELELRVASGELMEGSALVRWLQGTTLQSNWSAGKIGFRELGVRFRFDADRVLSWQRGYVRLENGWQFTSEGQRDLNRNLEAWAQWDRPDRQVLRWSFTGPLFAGQWLPETGWVRDWLANNRDYLREQGYIRIEPTGKGT